MRFLVLCSKPPIPANDGGTMASKALLDGLKLLGHPFSVITLSTEKHPFSEKQNRAKEYAIKAIKLNTYPKKIGALTAVLTGENYHVNRFYSRDVVDRLVAEIKLFTPDVVLLDGLNMLVYLNEIQSLFKGKILYRAHNVESLLWKTRLTEIHNPLVRRLTSVLVNRLMRFEKEKIQDVDAVIAISKMDEKVLLSYGAQKTFVLPFTINLKNNQQDDKKKQLEHSVGFLGALDWEPNIKGIQWFLKEVWPEVIKKEPNAVFHLAGRNAINWFKKLNYPRVKYIGEVESAIDFFHDQKVLVNPIFSGSGMRVKQAETMALGCVMVSTIKGAEGIELGKNSILVSNSSQTFANNIIQLLRDDKLRTQIGLENKRLAYSYFNMEEQSKNLIEWIKKL